MLPGVFVFRVRRGIFGGFFGSACVSMRADLLPLALVVMWGPREDSWQTLLCATFYRRIAALGIKNMEWPGAEKGADAFVACPVARSIWYSQAWAWAWSS